MITIGTVKFDFQTDNEPFALRLNGRWDSFFHTSFEAVVEEVLSVYNHSDSIITIDSLPLDLGNIEEEKFYEQFPLRLREALKEYCKEKLEINRVGNNISEGISFASVGKTAFEMLTFFLLHGYFPFHSDEEYTNLNLLLDKVLSEEVYRFREFLNAYGHYDFLCLRLVFQFSDEQLEQIVHIVQPSESKFINLYVQVQIRSYYSQKRVNMTRDNYRDTVWTLVLAYLLAESRGYFSRKQVIVFTLRGLAAHLNISFVEMVRIFTENIQRLESKVEQLPELWSILKEIGKDMQTALWELAGDYALNLMREVVVALRSDAVRETVEPILSREHLVGILSNAIHCRRLLQQLDEQEIHRLVVSLNPYECGYIITYAHVLDKHKNTGMLLGKAGSEFFLLKWEFIFTVLVSMPTSTFSRKQFVLSVLQHLAGHYNLAVEELIQWLIADEEMKRGTLTLELSTVLEELKRLFVIDKKKSMPEDYSIIEWRDFLQTPLLIRKLIDTYSEQQIIVLVVRMLPSHSEFIIDYAVLLDKGYNLGMLEGKAGGEFRLLKWEFILSCFPLGDGVAFHQKLFVYSVLQRLAAHYNQEVSVLISYFLQHITNLSVEYRFGGIRNILQELYEEHLLPMKDINVIRSKTDEDLEYWAVCLFGNNPLSSSMPESYMNKWLLFFLNERKELFCKLWKSGRLDEALLLSLVKQTPALCNLWLRCLGDKRLLAIYRRWLTIYADLRSHFREYGYLESQSEFLSIWMIELSARKYLAWSEREIMDFLTVRVYHSAPSEFIALIKKDMGQREDFEEMIRRMNIENARLRKEEAVNKVEVHNAGLMLIAPFFPMLFYRLGLLADDRKNFKDDDCRIRAIFVLQYLVYQEQREWPENELYLNKKIVGWESGNNPLPKRVELSEKETRTAVELLTSVCRTWDKMRNTSIEGFRRSFLERKGVVSIEPDESVTVRVEERAYDVLLDSVPWGYKMYRYPWVTNIFRVNWR